ncbi:Acyltransferase family protein [Falsiruegeria litorea R37]|uniref:Acyltransferase family protein n=1 Tax=Falsiruegeria litorea R37 TaxID=1200284 RepID=A0A1Y5TMC8_9RHOB|nr:acyltransferase [Falsiruegeria litorea]SLN67452.1 Acyltransferase family protein [Falsiruegeria litorea R37]
MTLAEAMDRGCTGNLDALRLVLAGGVIVSHAWPLALGPGTVEPLAAQTGRSLGGWAVVLFFFLSGVLITASSLRKSSRAFWRARALRIFPGLGGAVIVTLGLAMLSGATVDWAEATTWALRAVSLVSIEHRLTEAFANNPYPLVVNGPLWSLFYEVAAYGLCALIALLPKTLRPYCILFVLLVAGLGQFWAEYLPHRVATSLPLFFAFALGMVVCGLRQQVRLSWKTGLIAIFFTPALVAPLAIVTICLGVFFLVLSAPQIQLGADYSFGLYIYGWPVAQSVVWLCPGLDPLSLAGLSLMATMPFAMASWHLVERPSSFRALKGARA